MITAIQKIIDKVNATHGTSFTLDSSLACNCSVRFHQTTQEDWQAVISKICEYTGHIWYIDGTTVKVIDKLGGITPTLIVNDFQILEDGLSTQSDDAIVNAFKADWNTEVFDNTARTLVANNKTSSVSTKLSAGTETTIQPLDYVRSDITSVLERKKQIHLLDSVTIRLGIPQNVPIGQRITLDSDYAEGEFVVLSKRFTTRSDEELSGLGSITYKEFT